SLKLPVAVNEDRVIDLLLTAGATGWLPVGDFRMGISSWKQHWSRSDVEDLQ
ncbi:hypothetical protein HispidOSU_010284, partial [Sigmodon hispidus]